MAQEYTTPIEVRFSDLDAFNHVNSAVYFTYLETARVKLFSDFFRAATARGIFTVVARAACDYTLPITLYDPLQVTVWIARLGNASFDLAYRLHDGRGATYATATTTMVCFDSVAKTTVALPESIRAMA